MIRDSARFGSFDREQFARLRAAEWCRHSDCEEWWGFSPDYDCGSWHMTNRPESRIQRAEMTATEASEGRCVARKGDCHVGNQKQHQTSKSEIGETPSTDFCQLLLVRLSLAGEHA